jgi:hypothetical protein
MSAKRSPCVLCIVVPILALVALLVLASIGLFFAMRSRDIAFPKPGAVATPPAAVPAPAAVCCAATSCCGNGAATVITPSFGLNGPFWFLIIPVMALAVLLTFVIITGILVFLMLLSGGSIGQLSQVVQLAGQFMQAVPNFRAFIDSINLAADAMDGGRTATDLIAPALRSAATQVGNAAAFVNSAQLPFKDWTTEPVLNSDFYYVRPRRPDESVSPPFESVKDSLLLVQGQLAEAGNKTDSLGSALTATATQLRAAAHQLEAFAP